MTPALWVAVGLGVLGGGGLATIVVALINAKAKSRGDLLLTLSNRLSEVEEDLKEQREWRRGQENRYSSLWAYCRLLIDYAYTHRRPDSPGLPDMPDDLT